MSYTTHVGRYSQSGGSVPFSAYTDSFKTMGVAVHEAFAAVARGVRQAVQAATYEVEERRAVRVLKDLSDETLKDIGIRRSEIRYLARRVSESPGMDYRAFCQ